MTGPAWWTATLVVLLATTTATCLGHLVVVRCRRSRAVDAVDVAMGAVMLALVAGLPLGRGVALASVAGFGLVALVPAVRSLRTVRTVPAMSAGIAGEPGVSARQGVLSGAMVVMLVPLVVAAPGSMTGQTAMAGPGSGAAGLVVAAALTVVAVLGVGALDVLAVVRAAGRRALSAAVPTACRLAMAVTSVWMLVAMVG